MDEEQRRGPAQPGTELRPPEVQTEPPGIPVFINDGLIGTSRSQGTDSYQGPRAPGRQLSLSLQP